MTNNYLMVKDERRASFSRGILTDKSPLIWSYIINIKIILKRENRSIKTLTHTGKTLNDMLILSAPGVLKCSYSFLFLLWKCIMYCELCKQVHVNSGFFLVTSLFLRGYGGCVQLITYWNKHMLHIRKFYFKEIPRRHNAMNPKISDFYVFFLSWIGLWFQTISSSTPISELTSRQPPLPHLPPAPNAKN